MINICVYLPQELRGVPVSITCAVFLSSDRKWRVCKTFVSNAVPYEGGILLLVLGLIGF